MKTALSLLLAIPLTFSSASAAVSSVSQADLSGFVQSLNITNSAASTSNITSIVYSLGTAADGIATWDGSSAGGVASDSLSNARYFQTVTWSGLSIAPGSSQGFGPLDIDLIVTLAPLSVSGAILDEVGTSLANASLTVTWANGETGSTPLNQQAWRNNQSLAVSGSNVPDGGSTLAMLGIALAGIARFKKSKRA